MAHKKAGGSTRNGRDSESKRLGVKKYGGQAVLAGNIFKVHVAVGDVVNAGDPLLVVEAMKMETVVPAPKGGNVSHVAVAEGDVVAVGDPLVSID